MKNRKMLFAIVLCLLCLALIVPVGAAQWVTRQLQAVYRDISIIIDGNEIIPTDVNGKLVEPFIVDGTTYVPIRAIGEAFGKDVLWNDPASSVLISTPASTRPPLYYPEAPPAPSKNVEVSTAEELVKAIAPDTCITLKAGKYDVSTVIGVDNPYVYYREDFYGFDEMTLSITAVEGLTLKAAPGADVEIVTPLRFAVVLEFSHCNGVSLFGIKAGHSVTGDYECDAGVVAFMDCYNVVVDDCYFYGSGSIGIDLYSCTNALIQSTTVTDCSLRAVDIYDSRSISFTDCKFIDNRAYGSVIYGSGSSVEFLDCEISGNKSLEWSAVSIDDDVLFSHCVFKDNAIVDGSEPVFSGFGIRLHNCEIEKEGFSGYWEGQITSLGGNKLG